MKNEKIWQILGIEPTSDVDQIRDAYRARLVETNPEDNPEGFMALKEAYDTALSLAENTGSDEKTERPYADIIAEIDEIYKDINKRMDENRWKSVLSKPVFTSLDDQDSLRNEFLRYTMEHFKYPGNILKMLDNVFTLTQDEEALSEIFPRNFISFLCDNIKNDGDYVLSETPIIGRDNGPKSVNEIKIEFEGELSEQAEFEYEIDEYISTLNHLISCYRNIESPNLPEENKPSMIAALAENILQAREYDYYHPYEDIAVIRYLYYTESYAECFRLIEDRIESTLMAGEDHSDYYYSHLIFMYLRFFVQDIHKDMNLTISPDVLDKCEAALSKTMNEVYVNETHPAWSLVSYLRNEKRRAAEYMSYASEFIHSTAYDAISDQIDNDRLNELPGLIDSKTDNFRDKISLAWILSRKDRLDEALEVLDTISDEDKEDMEYYNIISRIYMNQEKYSEALPYLIKWNKLLTESFGYDKHLDKNELPVEDVRQITRVPYSFYLIAAAMLNVGDVDGAKENVKLALQGAPVRDYYNFTDLYNYILHSRQEYDEGLDFWTKEVEKNNEYIAICRGNRQFMAHKANDARAVIDDYFFLRDDDPNYIDSYVFAEDVYLDYSDKEGFETCLKYIERAGVQDVRLDYNMGRYYRTQNMPKEAVDIFKGVEAAIKGGYNGIEDQFRFYVSYGYALMDYDRTNLSNSEHEDVAEKLKEIVDTAIELYPDIIRVYWLKTDYCERYTNEADSIYKKMLEVFPDDPDVNYEYGRYLNNKDRDEEAIEQFKIGFEKNPDHTGIRYELSDYYNDFMYKEKELPEYNKKALELSSRILELEQTSRAVVNYALLLMDGMHYDTALEFTEKAIGLFPEAPFVHNARGLSLMYAKRFEEAEESFKKAIDLYQGTAGFAGCRNLVRVYQIENKFKEALEAYKNYTERFNIDTIDSCGKYGELYDDLNMFEESLEAKKNAFLKRLSRITGNEPDSSTEINICKALDNNPDIPAYKFAGLVYYLKRYSETLSHMEKIDILEDIADDIRKYMDRAQSYKPVEEMTDDYRDDMRYAAFASGNFFTYSLRRPDDAIKYFKQYIVIRQKTDNEEKSYYEDIYEAYDLMGRSYMHLKDSENASLCADKAFEYLKLAFGSTENYLNFQRYTPLRACRISGLYFYKGNRDEAFRLLDTTDTCLRCSHCVHSSCVDKIDRLGLYAELDGEYEKAIEYYELGIKLGGNDIERTTGIRECRRKLGK